MFTILHVDNSSFFRHIFKEYFEKKGYLCLSAKDIDAAYYLLQHNSVDLIVTALEIRGGGGEHLIKSINASDYRNIPIVVVTSNDSLEERRKFFSMGVIDYIPKTKDYAENLHQFIVTITEKDRARNALQQMKIAVLDDSKLELGIIRNILQLNGITDIDIYANPHEFLGSGKHYQVYFIDLVLPDISGEQIIISLRKKHKDSVIIAISAVDNYKVIASVLLSGADDYMMKPFNASIFMARLVSNVRTYLLLRELEKANRDLREIAITDDLTGIFKHHHVHRLLEDEVAKAETNGAALSMILLGIDTFSSINDEFGHHVGDRVIKSVAAAIRENLSEQDILGRYGGVDFMIILPEANLEEACSLAERIRQKVARISLKGRKITVSGGAVQRERDSAMEMVRKADSLLFNARKKGKNRIEKGFNWGEF